MMIKIRDTHKFYKQEVKEYNKEKGTSYRALNVNEYSKLNSDFNAFLLERLLEEGEIALPDKLGKLKITGKKQKIKIKNGRIVSLPPDWKATKELWAKDEKAKKEKKLVYYFNENTNNIIYKVRWERFNVFVANKFHYDFVFARHAKRKLSTLIKSGKEYALMDREYSLAEKMDRQRRKEREREREKTEKLKSKNK